MDSRWRRNITHLTSALNQIEVAHHVSDSRFHRYLVLASDGLWDVMDEQEVIQRVDQYLQSGNLRSSVSRVLVKTAVRRWRDHNRRADNTTIVVCYPEALIRRSEKRAGDGSGNQDQGRG